MENKKKRRITPRREKTPATIAETESHEMPTACHNQGVVLQEKQLDSKGYIDINHLRPYDRDWRIKVIVLRRGVVEPYTTAKGSGTMWKVILMDEQDVNDSIKSNGIIADVLALVIDVEPLSEVSKAGGVGKSKKRSVTLINSSCESILLTLWGDMATNEGDMLEKMKTKRPIVALSKVKISTYAGVLSMSTISITTLQVDPSIPETDAGKKRFNHNLQKMPGTTSSGKNKETAERVKISDVMERSLLEFQNTYCSFKATIIRIDNMEQPWYNACKVCNKKVIPGEQGMECTKCADKNSEHHPRYLMKITVGDGERQLYITLFEAAEKITGCSVVDFIKSKEEENNQGKLIEQLRHASGKAYIFWAKLDKTNDKDRTLGKLIADEVQNDEDPETMEITSDVDEDNKTKKSIKVEKG
ncbi:hypothetical protein RHGRI_033033 [Rhododendron griersonianum]|nr:hypothetical protein RHGRI_033033 [Rhododendron griersonianum]